MSEIEVSEDSDGLPSVQIYCTEMEKTYSVWTSGVNNWVKWEEKCGSGTAVSFWNRGDSIKGE